MVYVSLGEGEGKGLEELHVMTMAPKIEKSKVGVSFYPRFKETKIKIYIYIIYLLFVI